MTENEKEIIEAKIGDEEVKTDRTTSQKFMGSAPANDKQ